MVTFDAANSKVYKAEDGNAIASYTWDFGDGRTSTGQVVTHRFSKEGNYSMVLTITDLAGQTAQKKQKIKVSKTETVNFLVQSSSGALLAATEAVPSL